MARIIRAWLIMTGCTVVCLLYLALLTGCIKRDTAEEEQVYIPSLVDTLYPGIERQVVLLDGSGDYLYEDAFQRPLRSDYGFSRLERRLVAGWEILSEEGQPLTTEAKYTLIHPDWLKRNYLSGLTAEVFLPWQQSGMLVTIKPGQRGGVIFRPILDFRRLDREESPIYSAYASEGQRAFLVCRKDAQGGWLAVVGDKSCQLKLSMKEYRAQYPQSEITGRPGVTVGWSGGEFLSKDGSGQRYAFGWGADSSAALTTAKGILEKEKELREQRDQRTALILSGLSLRCEDKSFERAFAWSRLMVHNLLFEKDSSSCFLTGLPLCPWPDGWHTCLVLEGAVAAGLPLDSAWRCLEGIVKHQHPQDGSPVEGMFPGAVREDGAEFRIPEIAGLAAVAYGKLRDKYTEPSGERDDRMAKALAEDLMGTCRHRLSVGLPQAADSAHFLWSGASSPARPGANIETQMLFYKLRVWLRSYPRVHDLILGLPLSLIDGSGEGACGRFWLDYVVATTEGEFRVPMQKNCVLTPFGNFQSMSWDDRLTFINDSIQAGKVRLERHSERRVSIPLALGWYDEGDRRKAEKTLVWSYENEMIGLAGFRTLSPLEPDYQSAHSYLFETDPLGTFANGDVLIWSAGLLGDLLATTNQTDSLWALVDRLKNRVTGQGVYGGIAEAENAEPGNLERDVVGNGLHLTSTAEFVRLVCEHLIGVDQRRGPYVNLKPDFPPEWGLTTVSFPRQGGRMSFSRLSDTRYWVHQTGIEPFISVALEACPESGARAIGSLRLYPGEEAFVEFRLEEGGFWQAVVKKD